MEHVTVNPPAPPITDCHRCDISTGRNWLWVWHCKYGEQALASDSVEFELEVPLQLKF